MKIRNTLRASLSLAFAAAGLALSPLHAEETPASEPDTAGEAKLGDVLEPRPARDYSAAEKELAAQSDEDAPRGEAAVIETSKPYLLPRLFTIPTAYALQSYEVRFGGQGNIHSSMANLNKDGLKGSASIGLGGIMELGYQLDEYYTVENVSDKILMGYFKLNLLKESKWIPAASLSASKNLRSTFRTDTYVYEMDQDMYEVVLSKAFRAGGNMVSFHPGVQIIRDEVTGVRDLAALEEPHQATKVNPRLGISWQTRPKTLFMYELKMLNPTVVSALAEGIETHTAVENNLGIRYYIRNWLCIDSGIRHYYDTESGDDEMKLHANFVGVVPLAEIYERVGNYFKK